VQTICSLANRLPRPAQRLPASPAPDAHAPVAASAPNRTPFSVVSQALLCACAFSLVPARSTLGPCGRGGGCGVGGGVILTALTYRSTPGAGALAVMEATLRTLGAALASAAVQPPSTGTPQAASSTPTVPLEEPPMSPVMQQLVLRDVTTQEEEVEHHSALQRLAVEESGRSVQPQRPSSWAPTVEPPFNFAPLPSLDSLKAYRSIFVSMWMLRVVCTWPQTASTAKRRRLNALGVDCTRAGKKAASGTNAIMKTWAARIRTACAFSNFVGEVLCVRPGEPRPSNEEIDLGVQKFFRCLTAGTHQVITLFLKCRRLGYKVAGGSKSISAVTLKDYTSGLSFLFGAAKVDGHGGKQKVVVDCAGTTSPWGLKGINELEAERKVRLDAGTHIGNPMTTDDLKDFRGATHKDARHNGEHSLSSAPVTLAVMESLHNELVVKHTPAMGTMANAVEQTMTRTLAATAPSGNSIATPPSVVQADILTYIFYVFAFVTLARPVSLISLRFGDISFPDLMLANEQEFFNRYVLRCSPVSIIFARSPCDQVFLPAVADDLALGFVPAPPFVCRVSPSAGTSTSGSSTLSCASSRRGPARWTSCRCGSSVTSRPCRLRTWRSSGRTRTCSARVST